MGQQYLRSSCCMSLRIACFRLKQSFEADRWKAGCRTRVAEQRIFTHSIFRLTIYREVRARARCKHRLRRRCFTHVVFPPCDCASLRAVVEPVEHAPQRPVERWMFWKLSWPRNLTSVFSFPDGKKLLRFGLADASRVNNSDHINIHGLFWRMYDCVHFRRWKQGEVLLCGNARMIGPCGPQTRFHSLGFRSLGTAMTHAKKKIE